MARPGAPRYAGRSARPGSRWQPVTTRRLERRPAGRRAWRLPQIELPRLDVRWRRVVPPLAAALALGTAAWWVYQSPLLSVRDVEVRGASALPPDVVREAAAIEGQSIIGSDFSAARRRLLALPLVKSAEISHDWPNGATISIVERAPWGVWEASGQRYTIDAEGVVLDLPPPEGAPVIVQRELPAAPIAPGDRVPAGAVAASQRLVAEAQQTVGQPVVALEYSSASGLTVVLGGDLRVVFGDVRGYEFKIATLYAVLQDAQSDGRAVHRVDLRFGDRVAVQ